MIDWKKDLEWEKNWWGNCINTYGEETKQLHYASKMGLKVYSDQQSYFNIDVQGKNILDIGGGPVSMLLKCKNLGEGVVIDPCEYPEWVMARYQCADIDYLNEKAEDLDIWIKRIYDEVWIYNVLQHVEDPEKIVKNARKVAKLIRVFDWLEITGAGHPQYLTESKMNEWYGGIGKVEISNGGKEYSGIFKGDHYEG